MGIEEDWIFFLEKNPHFFELAKGDFFIKFLEKLSDGAKSLSDLKLAFPKIEERDLEAIMEAFLELRAVSRLKLGKRSFYSLTDSGKTFLAKYRQTKSFFTT